MKSVWFVSTATYEGWEEKSEEKEIFNNGADERHEFNIFCQLKTRYHQEKKIRCSFAPPQRSYEKSVQKLHFMSTSTPFMPTRPFASSLWSYLLNILSNVQWEYIILFLFIIISLIINISTLLKKIEIFVSIRRQWLILSVDKLSKQNTKVGL